MTSLEHFERWEYHDMAAMELLNSVAFEPGDSAIIVKAQLALVHAQLAHTHAYMMIKGLS